MDSVLQDKIISDIAKRMAKDIDDEVLMSAMGWHKYELELSEGRVYGARYWTVHPTNGDKWNEMITWVVDTFGPSSDDGVWTPSMRWYVNNAKFWFRDEKDLMWFIMRWS